MPPPDRWNALTCAAPLSGDDAYWHACTGTPYQPTQIPIHFDRDCPTTWYVTQGGAQRKADAWPRSGEWPRFSLVYRLDGVTVDPEPPRPVTVRQWFRTLRAADFERACRQVWGDVDAVSFWIRPELRPWSVFDTQKVVDRETAKHYENFEADWLSGRVDPKARLPWWFL